MSASIGYLGPQGSYSHTAALSFGDSVRPYASFFALVNALVSGEVQAVVLPVENSLNGDVAQNLDLLQETPGIIATGETFVKIEHRLITLEGAPLDGIKTIYSHPQALGQCAKFLSERFPHARQIPAPSTSAAALCIKDATQAGIAGAQFSAPGLWVSPYVISDESLNYTQFLYVVRGCPDASLAGKKIFLSFVCEHRPGALIAALSVFASCGINLTKIESRPIKQAVGEYRFFIEAEADFSRPETQTMLASLGNICRSIKILGVY